jgi:hypothetical protein
MKIIIRGNAGYQRVGGLSALYLALAYLIAMPYFLIGVDYFSLTNPAEKVALLAAHQTSMGAIHLVTYVVFGIVLAALSLALHGRMKDRAPVMMQIATAVGLIWAVMLVASGLVFNFGMQTVTALYAADPGQAVNLWQAIEPVTEGLGGAGGEILGGLWVLLVSWTALRTRRLPTILGWLGVAIGVMGVVSLVPALKDAGTIFGALQILWFAWIGIVMLRTTERVVQPVASMAAAAEA